jgi:soluble P-type ATPase
MVLDDQRMKVREIAETINISKERVGYNADKAMYRSLFEMRMQGEVTI